MSTVTWDAILVTVDGFGFGTLAGESCLKNVHCHTDRVSWDAILVTVVAFGALMWKKCAQSHRFGLGRVGGGGYHWGGVGEPRTGIIYVLAFPIQALYQVYNRPSVQVRYTGVASLVLRERSKNTHRVACRKFSTACTRVPGGQNFSMPLCSR